MILILPRITKSKSITTTKEVSNKEREENLSKDLKAFFISFFLNNSKMIDRTEVKSNSVVKFNGNQRKTHAVIIERVIIPEKKRKVKLLSEFRVQMLFSFFLLFRKRNAGIPQTKQKAVIIIICEISWST